jgi:hypothetical protein
MGRDREYDRGDEEELPGYAQDLLNELPPLCNKQVAGQALSIGDATVDAHIAAGRLMAIKIRGRVLIPRRSIVNLVVSSERGEGGAAAATA